jgi:uncharacterized membrane protein
MMRLLRWVFLGMFAYGVVVGLYGAALLALGMWAFVCYATRVFAAQEAAWRNSPQRAPTEPDTAHKLDEHCCECTRSEL